MIIKIDLKHILLDWKNRPLQSDGADMTIRDALYVAVMTGDGNLSSKELQERAKLAERIATEVIFEIDESTYDRLILWYEKRWQNGGLQVYKRAHEHFVAAKEKAQLKVADPNEADTG